MQRQQELPSAIADVIASSGTLSYMLVRTVLYVAGAIATFAVARLCDRLPIMLAGVLLVIIGLELAYLGAIAELSGQARQRSHASRSRLAGSRLAPRQKSVERGAKSLSPGGERILDLWRNLGMNDPSHHAVALQLPELLREHLLRDVGNRAFEVRESEHLAAEEKKEDHQFPASPEARDGLIDSDGRRVGCAFRLTHG